MNQLPSLFFTRASLFGLLLFLSSRVGFSFSLPYFSDTPPDVVTATSPDFPQVTCTSTDTAANAEVFDIAEQTRENLGPLLQISKTWRFPCNIHIVTEQDPLYGKVTTPLISVTTSGSDLSLTATIPANDPHLREIVQRQFVTELLWEKFFAHKTNFDANTPLDVIPFWLREGLRETLTADDQHSREEIVRRAAIGHRAPTLAEITNWKKFDDNELMGLWQRAFCFYLTRSLIHDEERRVDFRRWLTAMISDKSALPPAALFPTETAWQREMGDASNRSQGLLLTWDETLSALASIEPVQIHTFTQKDILLPNQPIPTQPKNTPDKKTDKTEDKNNPDNFRLLTLDDLATLPRTPQLMQAIMPKLIELTNLELRAHASWRDVIACYRMGLTSLLSDKTAAQANPFIERAKLIRAQEITYHNKLIDYLNWFEVNKDYQGIPSQFQSYFDTAQRLEHAQADEPNPLQADAIRVEKDL